MFQTLLLWKEPASSGAKMKYTFVRATDCRKSKFELALWEIWKVVDVGLMFTTLRFHFLRGFVILKLILAFSGSLRMGYLAIAGAMIEGDVERPSNF